MANRRIKRTKSFSSYLHSVADDVSTLQAKNDVSAIGTNTVTGAALAENVTLYGTAIQSSSYIPGVLGWKIDGTGVAEFGNVYVRGDINAETGTIGYWNISSPSVTRTIGPNKLYGTFLESADLGSDDEVETIGTYVSLFKSYGEDSFQITAARREANTAHLTIPGSNYQVDDQVYITIPTDTTYNNGGVPVTVIQADQGFISYSNIGTDTDLVFDTAVDGTALLYIDDIAGLYLRDYQKNLFDYAYVSNKGLAYVGAQKLNLVYNPSFEYLNTSTNTLTGSVGSWGYSGGSPTLHDFSADATGYYGTVGFYHSSLYGARVDWTTTAPTNAVVATVGYKEGDDYLLFSNGRSLYLGFDAFVKYTAWAATVSSMTANASTVVINTATAHGLVANDLVYLDFVAEWTGTVGGIPDVVYTYSSNGANGQVFSVLAAPSSTTFHITNVDGHAAPGTITRRDNVIVTGEASRDRNTYKVHYPGLDMSGIAFRNASGTLIANLYDVLTTETKALWATNNEKYMFIHPKDWMSEYLHEQQGIDPLTSSHRVVIDADVFASAYATVDPAGFALKSPLYVYFPSFVYKQNLSGTFTSTTKSTNATTMSLIYDSVSLSSEAKMFFGDKSVDYNWLDDTLNSPNQVSVESPRHWIDINLPAQTGIISNLDYLGFKSSRFTKSLAAQPSISTKSDYTRDVITTMPTGDYEYLHISSGQYTYSTTANYTTYEAYSNYVVSPTNSVAELVSSTKSFTPAGATVTSSIASVLVSSDSNDITAVDITADRTTVRNILYVGTPPGVDIANPFGIIGTLKVKQITNDDFFDTLNINAISVLTLTSDLGITFSGNTTTSGTSTFSSNSYWGPNSPISVTGTSPGATINTTGYGGFLRDGNASAAMYIGRTNATTATIAQLIDFRVNGSSIGNVAVTSGVVAYNSFMGSHYTEITDSEVPIYVGTVLETIDEMVSNKLVSQARLAKCVVSNTVASTAVYGVYLAEDGDEETADGYMVAAVGAAWVRMAPGTNAKRGDLVESNGDGCARVQNDDVIKSSTVGKITSNAVTETFPDGSFTLPCVLYCG